MGDRANIMIKEEGGGEIYLYSHWGGYDLPRVLANALDRGRGRWNDEPYLSRIIFSEMVKDQIEEDTGYGLSTYRTDWEYDDLIVDVKSQRVNGRGEGMSFDEFVTAYKS